MSWPKLLVKSVMFVCVLIVQETVDLSKFTVIEN
jgi:hypothetical protein